MKMSFEFDAKKNQPRVVLEAESPEENDQLHILASFTSVTFCVLVDGDDDDTEEVTVEG